MKKAIMFLCLLFMSVLVSAEISDMFYMPLQRNKYTETDDFAKKYLLNDRYMVSIGYDKNSDKRNGCDVRIWEDDFIFAGFGNLTVKSEDFEYTTPESNIPVISFKGNELINTEIFSFAYIDPNTNIAQMNDTLVYLEKENLNVTSQILFRFYKEFAGEVRIPFYTVAAEWDYFDKFGINCKLKNASGFMLKNKGKEYYFTVQANDTENISFCDLGEEYSEKKGRNIHKGELRLSGTFPAGYTNIAVMSFDNDESYFVRATFSNDIDLFQSCISWADDESRNEKDENSSLKVFSEKDTKYIKVNVASVINKTKTNELIFTVKDKNNNEIVRIPKKIRLKPHEKSTLVFDLPDLEKNDYIMNCLCNHYTIEKKLVIN